MSNQFMDMFVPKECLVDKPWKVENRDVWANCSAKRALPKSIVTSIVIVIIVLVIALVVWANGNGWGAVAVVLLGAGAATGAFFFNKWYFRREAELEYDRFEQDFAAFKREIPEGTMADYQKRKLELADIEAKRKLAEAQTNAALAQQSTNTALIASMFAKKNQ